MTTELRRPPIIPPAQRVSQPRDGRSRGAWPRAAPAAATGAAVTGASVTERLGVVRYLPAALFATLTVALAPPFLADALVPARGVGGTIATLVLAVCLSLALATAESCAWKRLHRTPWIVFSDLMLWNFARRAWADRRLRRIGAAYDAASTERQARVDLLEGLGRLLEMRNAYTYGHCRRVARHAERIARAMKLTAAEVAEVRTAALIHDVGKVYTPAAILHKPGALTDAEFEVIKRHAVDGADMLSPVRDRRLASIVRHHHERIDGSGYPDGLRGSAIPIGARIIAVADTFDAITSHRPYRRARSQREGLDVLAAEAGTRLDAEAVAAFVALYAPRRAVASVALSAAAWARLAPAGLLPGGLFGGASLAGVLPAVGAAGLLAIAPPARHGRAPAATAASRPAALVRSFPATLERGAGAGWNSAQLSPRAATRLPLGSRRRAFAPRRSGAGTGGSPAPAVASAGIVPAPAQGAGTSAPVAEPTAPIVGRAPHVEVGTPPATTPVATVPSIATPVGTTPAVPVPPVSLPGVTVPPPGAPSVSVGSGAATVGSTTVPVSLLGGR